MSDEQLTFAELRGLLCRLPGVSIASSDLLPTVLSMTVVIRQTDSIGPFVYCANGANIPVEVWTEAPSKPIEERSDPAHLRYRAWAKISEEGRSAALERFNNFGNFLAWYLHGVGLLPTPEANRLLTLWNGRHVAA